MALSTLFPAHAQSPSEKELVLHLGWRGGSPIPSDLACNPNGNCLVTWNYNAVFPNGKTYVKFAAAVVSTSGTITSERIVAEDPFDSFVTVAPSGDRFALFWTQLLLEDEVPFYQWFDERLRARGRRFDLPRIDFGAFDTETIPGGFVQAYDDGRGLFLRFLDLGGHESHPSVLVTSSPERSGASLSVDTASENITLAYGHLKEPTFEILFRRFSLTGVPLTAEFKLEDLPGLQFAPSVTKGPQGSFVATWERSTTDRPFEQGILGQRFASDGQPLGPVFQVNQRPDVTGGPQVRSDDRGNFAVLWRSGTQVPTGILWDLKLRLFRADGTPAGPEVLVTRRPDRRPQPPEFAFAPNGMLVIAWSSDARFPALSYEEREILVRRFSASPGDEPCVVGNGVLLCDTGRTGGEPEVRHGFGGPGFESRVLGDVDGDGREEPCVYKAGKFRCDADHEGGAAEVQIAFALPGSPVPLLGDIDGDGREDPCLAVSGRFSCDTEHDGGTAEITIGFGAPGEELLLGDIDGDKVSEACGYTPGLFRCDTGHDGGSAEWMIHFGTRGDQPILGDFDGDGREDPCVYRKGLLLCDTAHNGGTPEGTLSFGKAGDRVLLGNLDGL